MPITTRCPSCDRKLRVPDNLLGSRVKCPGCQTVFTAEDQGEEAPPPAAPAPRERPPERPRDPVTDRPSEARRRPALTPPPEGEGAGGYEDEPEGDYEEDRPRRGGRSRERAREMVSGPAVALMVTGGIGIALGVLNLVASLALGSLQLAVPNAGRPGPGMPGPGAAGPGQAMMGTAFNVTHSVIVIACGAVVTYGAVQMKNLRSRGWAMTGSVLAMIPCLGCCLLGLPFGIWSVVVLNKPEVVRAFG
jgi:predicted Zn finger-like uncharacterized protein